MGGIERGEHNVSLINIKAIANALKESVEKIMNKANL
jgi:hypothetical protein